MWMYDLTGGLRIGKRHERLKQRRRVRPPADACRPSGWRRPTSTTTPRADDARLVPDRRPHRGRPRRRRRQPTPSSSHHQGRATARHGRRRSKPTVERIARAGQRRRERRRGVGRRRPRPRRGRRNPDSIRPAKGVHITVPWARSATTSPSSSRCRRTSAACSWCRGGSDGVSTPTSAPPTPTTTGRLDDPQCTTDDIDYVLRALNASITTGVDRGPTSPGRGPVCGRW